MQPSAAHSVLASLPMIGSDNDDCPLTSTGSFSTVTNCIPSRSSCTNNTIMKPPIAMDLSSDEGALSDSTSSSSTESSDSDSDTENIPVLTGTNGIFSIIFINLYC